MCWGRGVRLLTLFAMPEDGRIYLGRDKVEKKTRSFYERCGARIGRGKVCWHADLDSDAMRRFFMFMLYERVGDYISLFYMRKSASGRREMEFAEQYAVSFMADEIEEFDPSTED